MISSPSLEIDNNSSFHCFSLSPSTLSHLGLAIATIRAGGVGILDYEFVSSQARLAEKNLTELFTLAESYSGRVGIRMGANQSFSTSFKEFLQGRAYWLILTDWTNASDHFVDLLVDPKIQVLLEITNLEQLSLVNDWSGISGIIARGHESAAWSSCDSAFLFIQKILKLINIPVYVQGGIGVHTAAACQAIGAAGVILDDQLWLMPESPLSFDWQQQISGSNGQEAILIGEQLGWGCRVFSRPGFAGVKKLQQVAEEIELTVEEPKQQLEVWRQKAQSLLGWDESGAIAWPMGQAVGLAATLRDIYGSTGRLVQAILQVKYSHIELAQRLKPLSPDAPMARSHGTRYPIVQGPMTRVSDSAAFAKAIAEGGGLPMLALALMRAGQVLTLLQETKALLGDRPWGIGILGFVPHELRKLQLEAVMQVKPPFALIAGGRPDQAKHLEDEGIATYLHVPTPTLLKLFLHQGAYRFVFEGRECGGHVGPLSSFVLWNSMIETLLTETPPELVTKIHILFAGGIHDARSAAMIAAMAAPLVEQGMKIGVLMGSAYLFTEEAVRHQAIVAGFQQVILDCQETVNLETGPGHASRCAVTPFAQEFTAVRQQMKREGRSPEEIKNVLEDLTLGRLRVASKGLVRTNEGIVSVDPTTQKQDGMYMIGQVATLRSAVLTIEELHKEVSTDSTILLQSVTTEAEKSPLPEVAPADIAIIGIGTLLPKAQTHEDFWQNILERVNCLGEIPAHRWDWRLYFDEDRRSRDKIYSKWGGFLEDIPFDPLRFGIPPTSLKSIEPMQLMTLEVVRRALADAGYGDREFDRRNTSVILGAGGGVGDVGQQYALRSGLPLVVEHPAAEVWDRLPEWTEESFPGLLLNVAAGRVANRFNFGGTNYTVDAACASSLTAISLAVKELESGRSNVAIAGGVDAVQNPLAYMCFSKTQALSPTGQPHPFDQTADGIVISEGIAVVVLKRLADAERDGDRIYAVIKAVEGSSDGKALGMTAPRPVGQQLAVRRAYERAGYSPATLGMYEAHGTGTVAGDRSELETITTILSEAKAPPNSCAIGSVKSVIGHTKATAGVAGLIKATLALYYKVLPSHVGVTKPLPAITDPGTPVYLLTEAQPWLESPNHPRRASVSAFGFGGTNFHALLEAHTSTMPIAPGSHRWPQELFVFQAKDQVALGHTLTKLLSQLNAGAQPRLRDLAFSCAHGFHKAKSGSACVSIVAESLAALKQALTLVLEVLHKTPEAIAQTQLPHNIQINLNKPETPPKIAFLFPGQGAQYPNMLNNVALYFPEMRAALEQADRVLQAYFPQRPLSSYIFPPSAFSEEHSQSQKQDLLDTRIAQPVIGTIEMGFLTLLQRLGINPQMVCGHSYGEYAALYAAGVLSATDFLQLSAERGRVMAEACLGNVPGSMAAIQAPRAQVEQFLNTSEGVIIANANAPLQTVISGPLESLKAVVQRINDTGIVARMLPVSGAFHSALMVPAQTSLAAALDQVAIASPTVPVYGNATAAPYPETPEAIRQQLTQQLTSPVNFIGQIEAMYKAGARVFIELGPKTILTNLTQQILADQAPILVPLDQRFSGLTSFLSAIGRLITAGVSVQLTELYRDRDVKLLNLHRLAVETTPEPLSSTTWLLNGGSIRRQSEAVGHSGKLPTLTLEAIASTSPTHANSSTNGTNGANPLEMTQPFVKTEIINHADSTGYAASPSIQINFINPTHNQLEPMTQYYSPSSPPSPAHDPAPPAIGNAWLAAFQSHQATMQQFLTVQERVVGQFLGHQIPSDILSTTTTMPQLIAAAPPVVPPTNGHRTQMPMQSLPSMAVAPVAPQIVAPPDPVIAAPPAPRMPVTPPQPEVVAPPMPVAKPEVKAQLETPQTTPQNNVITSASLTELVLNLVSDRTGYPTDLLGLDQDIEAELGIDSIKRVEIMGTLQKELPSALGKQIQEQMETLTQLKTLNGVIEKVMTLVSATEVMPGKPQAVVDPLPRFQMQAVDGSSATAANPMPLTGFYLITEDELGVAPLVEELLVSLGVTVQRISLGQLRSPEQLADFIQTMKETQIPLQGIVHLAPLAVFQGAIAASQWQVQTQTHVKSLVQLLQAYASELQQNDQTKVLSASSFGGYFGRNRSESVQGAATGGFSTGLLKTLSYEWSNVQFKAIDLDLSQTVPSLAQQIVQELRQPQSNIEVGYPKGKRTLFQTVVSPLDLTHQPQITPKADWVMLVTGGHRGITAETVKALMVQGMTLIIVGRSPEPQPESSVTQNLDDVTQLRRILLTQAMQAGDRPTPLQIEKALQRLLNDRTTRANLTWFRERGTVDYRAVDVKDSQAFGQLIEAIYSQYGRLDAVIHGAGIIEDKLFVDKQRDSFDRVFDTKANSAFTLSQTLRGDSLKLLVFFSSVAGRYGSRGQGDYAAANELVTRLAWQLHEQWKNTRVVAINWGPWDTTGMASEEVKRQFRERNIIPIPIDQGCQFFVQEICYGARDDVEVIAGQGPWELLDQVEVAPTLTEETGDRQEFLLPLIDRQPTLQADSTVTLEHIFSLKNDPYLQDHRLDNKPVLPAAGAAEWLAEFVQLAWSDLFVAEIRNLKLLQGVIFASGDQKAASFLARASSHADAFSLQVAAELRDPITQRLFYEATVQLYAQLPEPPMATMEPLFQGRSLDPQAVYRDYLFHGSLFQNIVAIPAITEEGIDAIVRISQPRQIMQQPTLKCDWILDPVLLDLAPQLAIVWGRSQHEITPLPTQWGSIRRYGQEPLPETLILRLRVESFTGSNLRYCAEWIDSSDRVRLAVDQLEGACSQSLNRLAQSNF